jgi:hypothetical protein
MLKFFIVFLLAITINSIKTKEFYRVVPSPSLEKHKADIHKAFNYAQTYIVEADFYLMNVMRIIYYMTTILEGKGIYIDMKAMWRETLSQGNHKNHLYIYFEWENPRNDPC